MGARVDAAYQHVAFVQDGPKAFLTFDRPDARNALNRRLIDEALDAIGHLAEVADAHLRADRRTGIV